MEYTLYFMPAEHTAILAPGAISQTWISLLLYKISLFKESFAIYIAQPKRKSSPPEMLILINFHQFL